LVASLEIIYKIIFKIPCSAEFPNSAALSISIYNAIKSAAVSRITNPDTPCGRITNAPEPVIAPSL
jgi:hypothetical protein